jgi:hypothetical protein
MGGFRAKILMMLFMFCAGFGTAVYLMTPSSAQAAGETPDFVSQLWSRQMRGGPEDTGEDAKAWAVEVRCAIDTCIHFAEENALRVADLIRSQTDQGSQ